MIYLGAGFERRHRKLSPQQKARVDAAVLRFQQSVGKPHKHAGIGLRPFGQYLEFRVGLDLRVLAIADGGDWFLMCVGDHDEIRAYIKSNPKPRI
jgi:hypothetical protein